MRDHGCWSVGRDPHQRVWGTYRAADNELCHHIGDRGFYLLDRRKRADYDDRIGGLPARQARLALDRAREILGLLDRLELSETCCPPAATPPAASSQDLERVRATYAFADEGEVTARLEEYPFLIPLLEAARGRLAAHFGPDAPVRIDLAFDPAGEDRSLFARVVTGLPPREALDRLNDFDEEWWLEARRASQNLLHFDVE